MTLLLRIDTIVPAGIEAVLHVVMPVDRRDDPEQSRSDHDHDDERRGIAARVRWRGPLGLVVVGRHGWLRSLLRASLSRSSGRKPTESAHHDGRRMSSGCGHPDRPYRKTPSSSGSPRIGGAGDQAVADATERDLVGPPEELRAGPKAEAVGGSRHGPEINDRCRDQVARKVADGREDVRRREIHR